MNAMGRLNASTEIIPLQGPSGRNEARFRQNFRPKPKPYFVDPHIVPRVKQYLEDHKDTVHVDMDAMVDELQRKYKDYARRKRNAFKQSVDKAFKTVLHQYGVSGDYDGGDLENSESSDEEMYSEDVSLENSSNTQAAGQLMNMYMNRPGLSVTPGLRPSDRMNLLSYQRPVLHRLHHHGDGIYIRPSIKQEPLEFRQRGFTAFQRRGEAGGGDKELINISSDEEDGGGGRPKSGRGGNAPSSSSVGLLPTPTLGPPPAPTPGPGPGPGGAMPSLAGQLGGRPGAGPGPGPGPGGAGAGAGGGSGGGPRGGAGSGPGAGGAGGEPSPMRPWPPATPAASSTPRQAKRPRPSGPSSAASSTTSASALAALAASAGPGAGPGPGARDGPAVKRRRDAASASAASAAHGPPLAVEPQEPGVSFADVGGVDDLLEEVGRLLVHLRRPEIFRTLGVPPPRGVLLHGPPGCGKSLLARAVAGELRLPLLRVAGPELVAGVSGESEARVRDLFEQAARSAPCVLFLDEVDALAPPRAGAQREMERRIVAQLLSCLDELGRSGPDSTVPLGAGEVLVLGATSRPEALDPALRRAGRFDREIRLGIPDARAREAILGILCRSMRLAPDVDLHALAKCTPGFVGADLQALTREAALAAVSRVLDDTQRGGAEATKDNEKTAAAEERNDESEAKIKDDTKASTSEEKEVSKEEKEETKMDVDKEADQEAKKDTETEKEAKKEVIENKTKESMEVIDISDRDTPNESGSSKTPAAKADSSVTKLVGIDEDEVCIEAEVTSSDAAAKDKTTKGSSTPDADDDMEVLEDELDEEVVPVPASEILHTKSLAANVWNTHFPALTDNQLENMFITQKDFEVALKHVQPSAKREGFATVPDISWDDVGALRDVREELQMAILAPVRHPDAFEALGLTAPAGLLLCGPPGCGKTLIAKAIANEADINFISVKGPELLNMYVGESEKAVRQCFLRARNSAPCVIFFDELDALCPRRTGGPSGEGSSATQRVVNQLLTEMDGVEGRRGVFLLAASNRPDILDPAVLRPGRLDRIVFVGLPGPDARAEILRALTKNGTRPRLAADVDLQTLGESADLEGCSGADLASLIREAATLALREHLVSVPSQPSSNSPRPPPAVAREHLAQAVRRLRPSVSPQERIRYEKLRIQFSSSNPIQVQSNKESPPSPSSSSASSQTAVGGAGTNANEMQTEPPKDLAPSTPADPSVSA